MTQTESKPKSVLLFLVLFLTVSWARGLGAQQPASHTIGQEGFLDTKIHDFEIHNQTLLDGLWKLARGPVPFAFGFEKVLKTRISDPDVPEPSISLQLKDKSIREILDALCQADSRYRWSMDGATVNLFPRAVVNDRSYLPNRKLARYQLKNATDVQNGLLAIVRQLPPPVEQIAQAQAGGDDPYPPEPWTVTFEDLTVRQVVNRLAAHGGPCAAWIFGGSKDFRAFGFFNTYLCSKQQPPWASKIIDSREKSAQP